MKTDIESIYKNRKKAERIIKASGYVLIFSIQISMIIYFIAEVTGNMNIFILWIIFPILIETSLLGFYIYLKLFEKNNLPLNTANSIIILHHFLRLEKHTYEEISELIGQQFPQIKKDILLSFLKDPKLREDDTAFRRSCLYFSSEKSQIRYALLYKLLLFAAEDHIFTIKEEEFIEYIRSQMHIPKNSYLYIKNAYLKRGVQEERKIIEEENRKKLIKSFVPYNAYKVLGVEPDVRKVQLKKVYRKLAKKYHPDKYHEQSEDIIQKAEDKFQEITEAYEIILKHIKA